MPIQPFALRSQYRSEPSTVLLSKSVRALAGISEGAGTALEEAGISTILDLAASGTFNAARRILEAAESPNWTGGVAADLIDAEFRDKQAAVVAAAPITALLGIGPATGASLSTALGVATLGELATWPPYLAAESILQDAFGMTPTVGDDPERPEDLVPLPRRYATERVLYDVIVLDKVLGLQKGHQGPSKGGTGKTDPALKDIVEAGGIDISDVVASALTAKLAIGAVLTYRQNWYPHGLALGHLLHSMALSPGESTRVAMVDWARRVGTRALEDTTQSETLAADLTRTRAMSEVTAAVASEAQSGFSGMSSTAKQDQSATSSGAAIAGLGVGFVYSTSQGTSTAKSTANTSASGWATSTGERSLNADMEQNISDRTQQAANSVRNRRATIVTETSQAESEKLTTRVVTNYNHMHALTIQYFEVVQIYRVVLELARKTRCLFLPMRLVSFTTETIKRFRDVIASMALRPDVRALGWVEPDQILLTAPSRVGTWNGAHLETVARAIGDAVGTPSGGGVVLPGTGMHVLGIGRFGIRHLFSELLVDFNDGSRVSFPIVEDMGETHPGVFGEFFPQEGQLRTSSHVAQDYRRFSLVRRKGRETDEGILELSLCFDFVLPNGRSAIPENMANLHVSASVRYEKNKLETVVFEMQPSLAEADVIDHLNQNALHYSSAIWRSLDAATITTMLSSYSFNGRPLIEQIDPVPITVAGNYIVFRTYADANDEEWKTFLEKHELVEPAPSEDMVPLPSGGVFAEAVLGRSNSAEKLDITRFWNWQDSPIPILPPEINPLTAGGKANDPPVGTAPLEGHVLNIVNPPSLPDPTGLAPLYSAIANGNMFRDMSGLAQVAALAQSALQAAQSGAAGATTAAGQAQQVAATQLTEFLKLIAQVATTALTAGAGGALGGLGGIAAGAVGGTAKPGVTNTPTNAGALINQGGAIDRGTGSGLPVSPNRAEGGENAGASQEPTGMPDTFESARRRAFDVALTGNAASMTPEFLLATNPTVASGLKAIGGETLKRGVEMLGGEVTKALSANKGVLVLPVNVTPVISGTSPDDYLASSAAYEAARKCLVRFKNLAEEGPGSGLNGIVDLQWLLVQYAGRVRGTKAEVKHIGSILFMKGITGGGQVSVGGALSSARVEVSIQSYGIDPKVAPPRIIVLARVDIELEAKTAINATIYGSVSLALDPADPVSYVIEYNKDGPDYFVVKPITEI